jgi:hypothetical protein
MYGMWVNASVYRTYTATHFVPTFLTHLLA